VRLFTNTRGALTHHRENQHQMSSLLQQLLQLRGTRIRIVRGHLHPL
jgi:hypothetical protein